MIDETSLNIFLNPRRVGTKADLYLCPEPRQTCAVAYPHEMEVEDTVQELEVKVDSTFEPV